MNITFDVVLKIFLMWVGWNIGGIAVILIWHYRLDRRFFQFIRSKVQK